VKNTDVFDLSGRLAIVVGSGSGLGQAIALGFARFGARIVSADLDLSCAKETARQVEHQGGEALAYQVDVSDQAAVQRFVSYVVEKFKRIDILVNSAGVASHSPAEAMDLDEWNRVMDANLKGTFLCCRAVGVVMLGQKKGNIINIVSVGGMVAVGRGTAAYGASKGGVVMLIRELAVEWASRGVRVNGIAPCQFRTPMLEAVLSDPQYNRNQLMQTWLTNIPLGRIGEAEEIVGPAVFLASDAASMVTGHILAVDGGYLAR
jgi:NAD(P)-dependent dehydrogenase (short-subunit alcohol dehydrogenase family)